MTIFINIFINILKKRKKKILYRSLFLRNQEAKQGRKGGRIKNKDHHSISLTKENLMSALPISSPLPSVFLETENKKKK